MESKKNIDRLAAALDLLRHYVEENINVNCGGYVNIRDLQTVFIVAGQKEVDPPPAKEVEPT